MMDELTCLLMDTAKLLKTSLTKSLKPYNLTCRQAIVLRSIEKESLSAKAIGKLCSIDKATLSAILDKLIAHGYISCKKNKDDKRENVYTATKAGLGILPEIASVENSCISLLKDTLSEKDYSQMILNLGKISNSLK
jgi:DNA-binding MarR family transcriptional regulator